MTFDELRNLLPVHPYQLHKDAETQADLAYRAGELMAETKALAKQAKMEVEEAKATADMEIRHNPETFGIVKITEAAVQSGVVLHPRVKETTIKCIEAEKEADLTVALVTGYAHRKSMIQAEVELYVSNYFGDPEVQAREMKKTEDEARKLQEARVLEKRRQKREERLESEHDGTEVV